MTLLRAVRPAPRGDAGRAGRVVCLGAEHYEVSMGARLVEQASWQELRRWSGARAWQLRFVTPACFRRGSRTSPTVRDRSVERSMLTILLPVTGRDGEMRPDESRLPGVRPL